VSNQQFVILARGDSPNNGLAPIGDRSEILELLSERNTAPESPGDDILYGPGIRIEIPPGEPVTQMLMTVVEDEIAWLVIERLARELEWKLLDPATGREWNP